MSKIKICGLKSKEDIQIANEYLPDYIGFVFANSKRQITINKAYELKQKLNGNIDSVGVFVNEKIDVIQKICEEGIIDYIQLHGEEEERYITELKKRVNLPVIKAIRVSEKRSVTKIKNAQIDYYLYDTYVKNLYGGSGKAFEWSILKSIKQPYFVAGGISKDNIRKLLTTIQPYCVDISSGVEVDGNKDEKKTREIIQAIRQFY